MKKSDDTKWRILDAAAKMFRRKGYEAATLKDIGKSAKVHAPAIYYYFDSKEKLLEEVLNIGIDRIHDSVREAIDAIPADASHRERVETAVRVHLATLLQHSDFTAANIINYALAPKKARAENHLRREAYGDLWRKLLLDAQKAGEIGSHVDLSLLRLFLIGALDWSHEWYRPEQKPIARMATEINNMLFDGIN